MDFDQYRPSNLQLCILAEDIFENKIQNHYCQKCSSLLVAYVEVLGWNDLKLCPKLIYKLLFIWKTYRGTANLSDKFRLLLPYKDEMQISSSPLGGALTPTGLPDTDIQWRDS